MSVKWAFVLSVLVLTLLMGIVGSAAAVRLTHATTSHHIASTDGSPDVICPWPH
jgi:hypothetical protein